MSPRLSHFRVTFAVTLAFLAAACSSGSSSSSTPPTGLSYADASPSYDTCTAITANIPTVGGGTPTSYAVSPALPTGLALDAATGVISGTPSVSIPVTTFTITAANSDGQTTVDIDITVNSTAPVGLSYGGATLEALVDMSASYQPSLTSGNVATWTITAGAVPDGMTFDTATGELSGTPTRVGTFDLTIEAANCEDSDEVDLQIEIQGWYPKGMYVTNDGSGTGHVVSSAMWDDDAQMLRPTGWATTNNGVLSTPVVHPDQDALYVLDNGGPSIVMFPLDDLDGRIDDASAASTNLSTDAYDMAITSDGAYLYASCIDGNVYGFAVDPSDHTLTALSPASIAASSLPGRLAVSHDDRALLVLDWNDNTLSSFVIDAATGALTLASTTGAGHGPENVAVSPDGWIYVATSGYQDLRVFSLDPVTAELSTVVSNALPTTGNFDVVLSPAGDRAYMANLASAEVLQLEIDRDTGLATPMTPDVVATAAVARGIAIDPRGERVYVTLTDNTIQVLDVGIDGALTASTDVPLAWRHGARSIVFTSDTSPRALASAALYAASYGDDASYQFGLSNGVLTPLSPPTASGGPDNIEAYGTRWHAKALYEIQPTFNFGNPPVGTQSALSSVQIVTADPYGLQYSWWFGHSTPTYSFVCEPSERFGYAICDAGIRVTTFDVHEAWVYGATTAMNDLPEEISVHPGGEFLLVPDAGTATINTYSILPSTGALTSEDSQPTGFQSVEALCDSTGRFVYVVCRGGAEVWMYSLDPSAMALTALATPPVTIDPDEADAAISPDGRFLAVADTHLGIRMFAVNRDTSDLIEDGALTPVGSPNSCASLVRTIEFDASSAFLYVGLDVGGVQVFAVDANGALDSQGIVTAGDEVLDIAVYPVVQMP